MTTASLLALWLIFLVPAFARPQQSVSNTDAQKTERATALVQSGQPEQAIPLFRELIHNYPGELSFKLNLAIALYKAGHFRETADQCEALLTLKPDLFPAHLFLGASQLKWGDSLAAEANLRKALALNPNDLNAKVMLGDALLAQRQWEQAIEQYEAARLILPNNPRVLFGLYRAYEAAAAATLEQLQKTGAGSAEALALEGQIDFDRAQFTAAFHHYRAAFAQKPSLHGIQDRLVEIYQQTGHADWAAIQKRAMPPLETCDASTLECDFNAGRWQEVAAASGKNVSEAQYWRARALLALSRQAYDHLRHSAPSRERSEAEALEAENGGRYRDAAAAWQEALRLEPNDALLERRLALALCHSNDCASALPLLMAQLQRDADSAELNYVCGLALVDIRKPAEAIALLERSVALDPNFVPAHGALGEAYLETGNPERAISHLQKATQTDADVIRHFQLARAYQLTNRHDKATAALAEYRAIVRQHAERNAAELPITPP